VGHHARVTEDERPTSDPVDLGEDTRRLAVTAVAAAAIGWWPAFTLGVYGVIFFEQHLALWAAATSVFVVAALMRRAALRRPATWTLLLPSLWLLLSWLLPIGGVTAPYQALFWLGVVVTVLGMPVMAALMVRLLIPGAERLRGRPAVTAATVVLVVMLASFVLGTQHPRLLSCEDFTISGNFAPENCTPGAGVTARWSL
jgi:hypothetical protein